jgi:hypothetical protein
MVKFKFTLIAALYFKLQSETFAQRKEKRARYYCSSKKEEKKVLNPMEGN